MEKPNKSWPLSINLIVNLHFSLLITASFFTVFNLSRNSKTWSNQILFWIWIRPDIIDQWAKYEVKHKKRIIRSNFSVDFFHIRSLATEQLLFEYLPHWAMWEKMTKVKFLLTFVSKTNPWSLSIHVKKF